MTYVSSTPPGPDHRTIFAGLLIMASIVAFMVLCGLLTTGCKHAAAAADIAANAVEAGATFDGDMVACEEAAQASDAGACQRCAEYDVCQEAAARKHNVPSNLGNCQAVCP